MPDYSKGKIYKIISNSTKYFYIGSTTQTLNLRFGKHKAKSKTCPDRKIYKAFDDIGWDDLKIIKIVDTPDCKTKEDLTQQEQKYIEELTNEWCLNSRPAWTGLNRKDYKKDYCQKNKEHKREYDKQYRQQDRDIKLQKKRDYHHKNRETILEKSKQYYQDNKERYKEYRDSRKEERSKRLTKPILCICCNKTIKIGSLYSHNNTKSHIINFIEY